jgi:hypothetical protein
MLEHDAFLVVIEEEDTVAGSKGLWNETSARLRRVAAVAVEDLSAQLQKFAVDLCTALENVSAAAGSYELDAVEVTTEITSKGEIRMIGSVGADVKGGLKLVFRKRNEK